jgi:hypothetical protein
MPITITITDGTTTPTAITIADNRADITAAALSAAVGDTAPPANDARAIRAAIARWIATTRRQHRQQIATAAAAAALDVEIAKIAGEEPNE